jgi:hypothetical protein
MRCAASHRWHHDTRKAGANPAGCFRPSEFLNIMGSMDFGNQDAFSEDIVDDVFDRRLGHHQVRH